MQNIKLDLHLDEVNGILQILGQMPSSSNVWPLMQKIQKQAQTSVQTSVQKNENEDASNQK